MKCITLEQVLTNHSLMEERLFFKVDTEGGEALLIPSLLPLIRKLKHKPTCFISKHRNSRFNEPAIQQGFLDLIAMYRCHRFTPASHETPLTTDQILNFKLTSFPEIDRHTVSNIHSNPDLILIDEDCATVDAWIQDIAHFFA